MLLYSMVHRLFSTTLDYYLSAFVLLCTLNFVNGRIYTNGLSIINAPSRNSEFQAGARLSISIEVSQDGKLPSLALQPGSNLPTRYDGLDIYLVSSQTNINFTISAGPQLLAGGHGSVRHLDQIIPVCIPRGQYNLTFYETSHIKDEAHLTITQIPIRVKNDGASQHCSDRVDPLMLQPKSYANMMAGLQTDTSTSQTPDYTTYMASITTFTTVVTTTEPGQETPVTITYPVTVTTTIPMVPTGAPDFQGFFPVNVSCRVSPRSALSWLVGIWPFMLALRRL